MPRCSFPRRVCELLNKVRNRIIFIWTASVNTGWTCSDKLSRWHRIVAQARVKTISPAATGALSMWMAPRIGGACAAEGPGAAVQHRPAKLHGLAASAAQPDIHSYRAPLGAVVGAGVAELLLELVEVRAVDTGLEAGYVRRHDVDERAVYKELPWAKRPARSFSPAGTPPPPPGRPP